MLGLCSNDAGNHWCLVGNGQLSPRVLMNRILEWGSMRASIQLNDGSDKSGFC